MLLHTSEAMADQKLIHRQSLWSAESKDFGDINIWKLDTDVLDS